MIVWVDVILSFLNTDARNDRIKADLKSKFEVNMIRNPSMILGIKLLQKLNLITLSQTHFIDSLLKKFGLEDANPVTTPLDQNINLDDNETEDESNNQSEEASHGYATLIGSLMYLALGTCPDIAYAVNKLAQFTQLPKLKHWTTMKQIFHYLKGTQKFSLTYGRSEDLLNQEMNVFCDANWAGGADRYTSGYIITITGEAIAWSSKKQNSIALSTAEAEYIAATHTAKQILWQCSLFQELKIDLTTTSTIFSDNQAAIVIAHHPEFHARTKHIDIAYHFLRDLVKL